MSKVTDQLCENDQCRCSAHPENCCNPESIQNHKELVEIVDKRERARRRGEPVGTFAEAVGN